jgi:hypothetical protein
MSHIIIEHCLGVYVRVMSACAHDVGAYVLPQASTQQEVSLLREQRDRVETKHQVELTALSSNLAAVRQQVEGGRKKMEMSEGKIRGLTQQLEGTCVCT